jgi:hypothetical protein
MKTALAIIMRSFPSYLIFPFLLVICGIADFSRFRGGEHFRLWQGGEMSSGQEAAFYCFQAVLLVGSGYFAFKRVQHDWKLWERSRGPKITKR